MPQRFIRQCRVQVFHDGALVMSADQSLRIRFAVRRDASESSQPSTVSVYNLSRQAESVVVDKGDVLRLEAGYRTTGLSLVYEGEIRLIDHDREGLDRVMKVQLGGADEAKKLEFVRSYSGGVGLRTICEDAVSAMGLHFDRISAAAIPAEVLVDWSWSGLAREALSELLKPRGIRWYEINRTVYFAKVGAPAFQTAFVVSQYTGMIGSAGLTEDNGAKGKVLLSTDLTLDQVVKFESETVNGLYAVDKLAHIGDTRGNEWWTEFEALNLEGTDVQESVGLLERAGQVLSGVLE